MRAVVHRQLRAHPPCPTQRPQPPPHSTTRTAPPTPPHTAPAPAPTHHKAHSHADGSASRTHLCDHHRDARRGEEEHDGMIAHQLLLQLGHLLRLAGAPSTLALHGRHKARAAERDDSWIRATFGQSGGKHGNAVRSSPKPLLPKEEDAQGVNNTGRTARCTSYSTRYPRPADSRRVTEKVSHGGSTCAGRAPCGSSCHPESGTAPDP